MINAKTKLYRIISEQFSVEVSEINDNQGPGDLPGWDSIGHVQLILQIEQSFGISLSVDNVIAINNISDIISIIAKNSI